MEQDIEFCSQSTLAFHTKSCDICGCLFPAKFLFQNYVYAVGGNDGVASLSSVEKYDPHLDKWIEVKEMGQRRAGNGVSELHGCLYVVGE